MINCKDCTSENTLRMLYLYTYFVSLLELELTNNISIQFVYIIEILYNENRTWQSYSPRLAITPLSTYALY